MPDRPVPSHEVTELMAELLDVKPGEKLMEIGTGTMFQTERWAKTGAEVHTIECRPMVNPERKMLEQVYAHIGDGKNGLPHEAPFDAIICTCGAKVVPSAWVNQLREGGRLVMPLGSAEVQSLVLLVKTQSGLEAKRTAAYVRFAMMQ